VVTGKKYEGAEVWGSGPDLGTTRDGAQAEYVVVPEQAVSPKPRNLSLNKRQPSAVETVPFENAIQAYERLVTGTINTKQALTFSTNQTH